LGVVLYCSYEKGPHIPNSILEREEIPFTRLRRVGGCHTVSESQELQQKL